MNPPYNALRDSDAFEELTYDVLAAEGFTSLSWRGPGADGGRDIEAAWQAPDPAGSIFHTKWYVECKWYTDSVPFGEIEPKLLAASAARADYLLIVTSSRVRNTAMDTVQEWLERRGHPFRVRYWIGAELLRRTLKHGHVFRKHFPGLAPPPWADASAEITRLKALVASSTERMSWRILPAVQWISGQLSDRTKASTRLPSVTEELELVSSLLRAHELSSTSSGSLASARSASIKEITELAVRCVGRRAKQLTVSQLDDCVGRVNRPLLLSAVFELCLNASLYSENGSASISLRADTDHWRIEVSNHSSEHIPIDWPVVGYRGRLARSRYPAGQGLGCALASEATKASSLHLAWEKRGDIWISSVEGATK